MKKVHVVVYKGKVISVYDDKDRAHMFAADLNMANGGGSDYKVQDAPFLTEEHLKTQQP